VLTSRKISKSRLQRAERKEKKRAKVFGVVMKDARKAMAFGPSTRSQGRNEFVVEMQKQRKTNEASEVALSGVSNNRFASIPMPVRARDKLYDFSQ